MKTAISLVICSLLILLSQLLSWLWFKIDFLPRTIIALGDVPFNVFASLLTIIPFSLTCKTRLSFLIIWAAFIPVVIDFDHFVLAGSFGISDVLALPCRPVTHSFVIVFLFAMFLSIVTKSREIGIISFFSLSSHLLIDAPFGKNFLYYPISLTTYNIRYQLCVILLFFFPTLTLFCGYFVMRINILNFWLNDSEGAQWYNLLTEKLAKPVDKTFKFLSKMII